MNQNGIAAKVVGDMIELMESTSTLVWHRPWSTNSPRSLAQDREYRGVNRLALTIKAAARGFGSPYWATVGQVNARNGRIKKGELGTPIVFWDKIQITRRDDHLEDDEVEEGTRRYRFLMKLYHVWNVEQTTIPAQRVPQTSRRENWPIEAVQRLFDGYLAAPGAPRLRAHAEQAFYRPTTDEVFMPPLSAFESAEAEAAVKAHELIHSTGAKSRLNRPGIADPQRFASHVYSAEEIIAELGSRMLLAHAGIEDVKGARRSCAYVKRWLSILREEPKMLISAASKAEAAVDFFLAKVEEGASMVSASATKTTSIRAPVEAAAK